MSLLGVHLTVLMGPTVPLPAPPTLLEALDEVEVTQSDAERSGFRMVFRATRDPLLLIDYPIVANPLLRPGTRVILQTTIGVVPEVLFDGIITHQQLNPSATPGETTFTVTGEDVSVAMDRQERVVEHPAQPEAVIALKIIASYPQFGFIPEVIPPVSFEAPVPAERTPVQRATDLGYLVEMAERYAYVFFVTPGPVAGANRAYWGPPPRLGLPSPPSRSTSAPTRTCAASASRTPRPRRRRLRAWCRTGRPTRRCRSAPLPARVRRWRCSPAC